MKYLLLNGFYHKRNLRELFLYYNCSLRAFQSSCDTVVGKLPPGRLSLILTLTLTQKGICLGAIFRGTILRGPIFRSPDLKQSLIKRKRGSDSIGFDGYSF